MENFVLRSKRRPDIIVLAPIRKMFFRFAAKWINLLLEENVVYVLSLFASHKMGNNAIFSYPKSMELVSGLKNSKL